MSRVDQETRQKIVRFVEDHASEQLGFVIDLANQNTFSYNKAGTDRLAGMILEKIGSLFANHRVMEQEQVGDLHLLSNREGGKTIHLLGHMDTVFPPDHPFQRCQVKGDELHGPGAGDMKAGLATIVYSVLALSDANVLEQVPLTIALNGDEEIGAITSKAIYETERENALACLVVEGGGMGGEIVVSRNGKMGLRLDCTGKSQHVGAVELDKASAVLALAHKTIALEALNGQLPGVRLNVGKIEGGLGPATIPARASALIDVRWEDQSVRDDLLRRIEAVAAKSELPGCESRISVMNERSAWSFNDNTRALADLVREVGAELGQKFGQEHRLGTSDSNFFGAAEVPTIDGLGPICKGYHTQDELVYISSIKERTILLANVLWAAAREQARGGLPGARLRGADPGGDG